MGADGARTQALYDIRLCAAFPNMSMACPADERECRQLLSTAFEQGPPVAVQGPRGSGAAAPCSRRRLCRQGRDPPRAQVRGRRQGAPHCHPGISAPCCIPRSKCRGAGRHGGQHALGQAAGRPCCARWAERHRCACDGGGRAAYHGWCGQRRDRGLQAAMGRAPCVLQLGLPDVSS